MALAKTDGVQVFAAWHNRGMVSKHANRPCDLISQSAKQSAEPQALPKRKRLLRKIKR
jgi:hypothetical protein